MSHTELENKIDHLEREIKTLRSENARLSESIRNEISEKENLQEILQRKKIAMRELLEQINVEKKSIREEIMANVDSVIMPSIKKLQKNEDHPNTKQLTLLERSFKQLIEPFGDRLDKILDKLTPRELEICHMIRNGLTVKEISRLSHTSPRTIETHRNNIRKKLGLANKKVNLAIYLRTL